MFFAYMKKDLNAQCCRKDQGMDQKEKSELQSKLPIAAGINGRGDYLLSAVLVLLIKIQEEYHILFQKRSKHIRQAGEICFPGGMYDTNLDYSTKDTALRETAEEIGLMPRAVDVIGALDYVIAPMGVIVEPFLAAAEYECLDHLKLSNEEVEKVFTLPLAFFKQNPPETYQTLIKVHPSYINAEGKEEILFPAEALGLGETYTKPWGRGQSTVYVYRSDEGLIWGLTAKIIYDLVQRLD